jgi:nucleotide-binding universal stress UspA family protein
LVIPLTVSAVRREHVAAMSTGTHAIPRDQQLAVLVGVDGSAVSVAPPTLAGRPANALAQYARDGSYDVIVVAPRGKGASRVLFGSVASHLARGVGVPLVILPAEAMSYTM